MKGKRLVERARERMIQDASINGSALTRVFMMYGCVGDFDEEYFSRIF